MFAKIITQTGITVFVKGIQPFTMARDHKLFPQLEAAVKSNDVDEVLDIISVANRVANYAKGNLTIIGGEIFYGDEVLHGVLVERILALMAEDEDADSLIKFLENLMENPSKQSREELYLFLEKSDLPITEDGRFIAYKWIRDDYTDCHTGKFDNSVGKIVKMPRRDVNDDRQQTCSTGLHVCSKEYTKFGKRLMLVAVNPRDVVSVPYDYNNAKMRVCEYEVIQELPAEAYETPFNSSVYRAYA